MTPREPREILILKPGGIGDLLHLTPAVRAINERVPCVPCRSRTCRHVRPLECMERISVEEVFAAVAETVGGGGSGAGRAIPGGCIR